MKKTFLFLMIFSLFFFSLRAQESKKNIKLIMAGINQYKDYSEIKKIVSKIENLELAYDSSTQKLQIFKGTYSGEIQTLLTNLGTDLPPQFIAKEKQLPNQITEITILPQ